MQTLLLSIFLIALVILMLGVKVLFVKGAKFPSGHIHESDALRNRGITCAHSHSKSNQKIL